MHRGSDLKMKYINTHRLYARVHSSIIHSSAALSPHGALGLFLHVKDLFFCLLFVHIKDLGGDSKTTGPCDIVPFVHTVIRR